MTTADPRPTHAPKAVPAPGGFRPSCAGCGWVGAYPYVIYPPALRAARRHAREAGRC